MKPEQQRIAIARACGEDNDSIVRGLIPDYLNDLNAMHEAEKILSDNNQMKFRGELVDMMRPKYGFESACLLAIHATAAQRAEAFLRTLNLWKEKQ